MDQDQASVPMVDRMRLESGCRKTLAKALTLVESTRPDHREEAERLLGAVEKDPDRSIRIGLTGIPGVGKSTLIDALGGYIISQGHRPAVLAVDPTSSLSGGSILGDKTRMPGLAASPHAFIRPTPAGESPGGVARRTRDAVVLCEAAGYDVIIVETVGVGQSEALVSSMTDLFILMLLPGAGDTLQGIKRGVMELADMVVVNKADGDMQARARLSAAEISHAIRLIQPRHEDWIPPVLRVSAADRSGIEALWRMVCRFRRQVGRDGRLSELRRQQAWEWMWTETRQQLLDHLKTDEAVRKRMDSLKPRVLSGDLSPSAAAAMLVAQFREHAHGSRPGGR